MNNKRVDLPLVYSCSGCSNIAQLANNIAVELNRDRIAEMSCIAGVGGGVPSMVKKAKSTKTIIALDGCHLHCVKNCLSRHDIKSTHHFTLTDFGVKKKFHQDWLLSDTHKIKKLIISRINQPCLQATN